MEITLPDREENVYLLDVDQGQKRTSAMQLVYCSGSDLCTGLGTSNTLAAHCLPCESAPATTHPPTPNRKVMLPLC